MSDKDIRTIDKLILTDGGLETTLIYHHGIELNHFAAFELLKKKEYSPIIRDYYQSYLNLAKTYKTGFILESATWRANPDWGNKLGFSEEELNQINSFAITQLQLIKLHYIHAIQPLYISGCIGPRTDGYKVIDAMTSQKARAYHTPQIKAFKNAGADMTTALTINYIDEGLGIAEAAKEHGLSVVISFTTETDGNLPSGETIEQAIEMIDNATNYYPLYYMLNCTHPSHFMHKLKKQADWMGRIMGIRANASHKTHAELDASTTLDAGDKDDLANWYLLLKIQLPNLKVYGGCCGTDLTHMEAICKLITP